MAQPTQFIVMTVNEVAQVAGLNPHSDVAIMAGHGMVVVVGNTAFVSDRSNPILAGLQEVGMADLLKDVCPQVARDKDGKFIQKPYLTLVDGELV